MCQEVHCFYWNLKVYLHVPQITYHWTLTQGSFISSFKINFKISVLLKWSVFFRFCYQMSPESLKFPVQAAGSVHLFILDLITPTIFGEHMQMTNSSLQIFLLLLLHMSWVQKFPSAFLKHLQALNHRNEI